MPEGPSIVLLKEETEKFAGKKVISVSGNTKIEQNRLLNRKVVSFKSWGKHFLICFKDFTLRIHFLMFGTYLINARKDDPVRLNIVFENGEINLYSCSIKILEGDVNSHYDFTTDVMDDRWNPEKAIAKLETVRDQLICDALLDQDIFSGVGNIIKNEVLYRVRIHPESQVKYLSARKIKRITDEARIYSFEFLNWKRKHELKKHWLIYNQMQCVRCNLPVIKKYTGLKDRRSFFCVKCQRLYK